MKHELAVNHETAFNLVTGGSYFRRYEDDDEKPTEEELLPKIPFGFTNE